MTLEDNDIHLRFLINSPIEIENIGKFYSPSIESVVSLSEEKYNMSLSALLFDKSKLEDEEGRYEEYSDFEILSAYIYQDPIFRKFFLEGLELHFDSKPFFHEEGIIYFDELSESSILTEERHNHLKRLVRIANFISEEKPEDEYVAGNERAKKFIERLKKKKAEARKLDKGKINLHSIISAVGWKSNSLNLIKELNIYQLYNGYQRFEVIDNYHYTLTGIYSGSLDASKIKLPDINWANIINIKNN